MSPGVLKTEESKPTGVPPMPLPVTLLSGFLGAGKTTLLQHILRSDHGLKIAVIVNDIGAVNVDASLIKQTHRLTRTDEKVIALQNGCICCTLRGDLLEELVRLSELQEFDYIIIESSGISEPEQVAETFDQRLADTFHEASDAEGHQLDESLVKVLEQVKEAGGLDQFARLDTTVTVIDAFTMLNDFDTAEMLSSRRHDVEEEDERTVSDLMVDQIEFADVIILNKTDMVSATDKARVLKVVKQLNHRAKILESSFGKVNVADIVNTGAFKLEEAKTGYGWLQDLHNMTIREVHGRNVITPKPETEEYNIQNFVYTKSRPFHPARLFQMIHDQFILQLEHFEEDEDEDDCDDGEEEEDDEADEMDVDEPDSTDSFPDIPGNDTILANKRSHPVFKRLFRSKGEFFLATRPNRAGEWSQAGAMLRLNGGRKWFCIVDEEEYLTGSPDIDAMVLHDIEKGGWMGDRRQEIVFIGENLDHEALKSLLDGCLLDDGEFGAWEKVVKDEGLTDEQKMDALANLFDDGFPDWAGDDDEGEDHEGHHHNHDGHHHVHKKGLRSIKDHMEVEEEEKIKEVD